MRARRAVMEAECQLRQQEADILGTAASSTATNGATFQVDDMNSLLRLKSIATNSALGLAEEIAELDREIWLLDRKCVGKSEVMISITLFARRGFQIKFQLSYCEWLRWIGVAHGVAYGSPSGGWRELEPVVQSLRHHRGR